MTIVDSLRLKHPDLILIDGGDWGDGNLARSMTLFRGMQALKYDAFAMGRRELTSALRDSIASGDGIEKSLIANLQPPATNAAKNLSPRPFRMIDRHGIKVAVMSVWMQSALPANGSFQILPPEKFLRDQLAQVKKADIRLATVYGNGNNADPEFTAFLEKFPEIDAWLLAGGPGRVMNARHAANGALIVGPGDRGRELGLVTIEKSKEITQRRADFKQVILGKWVKGSAAAKVFLENPTQDSQTTKTSSAPPAPSDRFIGNGSCKLCHEEIYQKWAATPHAHAFETLIAKKENQNQNCVACHTTGFGRTTGFGQALDGVELGNVGCEACHGSGEYHVTTGNRNKVVPDEALCKSCHDPQNSPKFIYGEYVKKVH